MSFYLGPFYIKDGDLFFILGFILIILSLFFNLTLPYIRFQTLLLLVIFFLFARGMLPLANAGTLYFLFITALFASIFFPLPTIILYLVISSVLLKITRKI